MDFDERDLLTLAERAGFRETHLELQVRIMPMSPLRWDVWVHSSPHPLLPTIEEAMHKALTPEEMARCVTHLQPLMESGQGTWRGQAVKPPSMVRLAPVTKPASGLAR